MRAVYRALALPLMALSLSPFATFHSSIKPLTSSEQKMLKRAGVWHQGCPVPFSGLRVLRATYWGFDGHAHAGELVVNRNAAPGLAKVFRQLYRLHFRIHHMNLASVYGKQPRDGDPTGSFECRQAVPSPCTGGKGTGTWSNHAYGLAVDINPVENPYVGCGMSRDPLAQKFRDRSRHRTGMVTPRVIAAFRSIGWGWGGSWTGNTKDYMHFSHNGH
jgi:D-alanyl-D-alanine carboxypeptidase